MRNQSTISGVWCVDIKITVQSQHRVCPPFARVASRILLAVESTRELIFLRGIWFHFCYKAPVISWTFWGTRRRDRTCLVRPIGVLWGEGQDRKVSKSSENTLFWAKKSRQARATCGLALSCWNVSLCCCTNGTTFDGEFSVLNGV